MLKCLSHPSCTVEFADQWIMAHATLVRPAIDLRRLQRATNQLIARHDSLRIRFNRTGDVWTAAIEDITALPVEVIDLGEVVEDFSATIRKIARRPMDALAGRLAEILLVKCGSRGDVLITRVHHTVADGFGMIVLAEDLMKFLLNMPVTGVAMSHVDYQRNWQFARGDRRAKIDEFWKNALKEFPKAPRIGRKLKGLEPLYQTVGWRQHRTMDIFAKPGSIKKLTQRHKRASHSVDALFYTAAVETLCRMYGEDEIVYQVAIARAEPALANFCGDRVSMALLRHRALNGASLDAAAADTQARLMEAINHLPAEAANRGSPSDAALIADGCHPGQFTIKTPRADLRARQSVFRKGFGNKPDQYLQIGPYRASQLDVACRSIGSSEYSFALGLDSGNLAFRIGYDVDAYTHDELESQALQICALVGLEPEALTYQ